MTNKFMERIIPTGMTKAEFVDEILLHMSNMHSLVEIQPADIGSGVVLVRSYEIDDDMLDDYGVPAEVLIGKASSLEAMHNGLIRRFGVDCRRAMLKKQKSPLKKLAAKEAHINSVFAHQSEIGTFRVAKTLPRYTALRQAIAAAGKTLKLITGDKHSHPTPQN